MHALRAASATTTPHLLQWASSYHQKPIPQSQWLVQGGTRPRRLSQAHTEVSLQRLPSATTAPQPMLLCRRSLLMPPFWCAHFQLPLTLDEQSMRLNISTCLEEIRYSNSAKSCFVIRSTCNAYLEVLLPQHGLATARLRVTAGRGHTHRGCSTENSRFK